MRDDGEVDAEVSTTREVSHDLDDVAPQAAPSRRLLAVAGALAGAAGIALSEATSSALRAETGPVAAVAAAVRDLTPGPVAHFLISIVRTFDKPLLVTGTTVILLGICAYAATWVDRRPVVPDVVFFVLAGIGLAATLRLPNPGFGASLAIVVGLITWIVVLRMLTAPLLEVRPVDAGRRSFLVRSAAVVGVAGVLVVAGRFAGRSLRHVEQARRLLRLPVKRGEEPAGSTLGVDGIAPWRSPNEGFYVIHTALAPPSIAPEDWSLRIHGLVEREITLDYKSLLERQLTEAWVTLCCVSNEVGGDLIGNAWWSGVLVRDLLREAGVQPGADAVLQTSRDGWTAGTPLAALTDDRNAMLAVAMNGQPLPVQHGFPVRMVVPGLYGYVSATKWLVDLEVTSFSKFEAYWTQRGWSEKGPVKTESRVDVPRNGASVEAGKVRVGGSAWSQHRGIAKVEFQLDGGPWQEAELGTVPNVDTWVQWAGTVDLEPGEHRVTVRATDKTGYTQTPVRVDVIPDGATGWHSHPFTAK
jgi:DMSO/TMAO reductase YedYZ molybdopterin-dependent catalytic subunit